MTTKFTDNFLLDAFNAHITVLISKHPYPEVRPKNARDKLHVLQRLSTMVEDFTITDPPHNTPNTATLPFTGIRTDTSDQHQITLKTQCGPVQRRQAINTALASAIDRLAERIVSILYSIDRQLEEAHAHTEKTPIEQLYSEYHPKRIDTSSTMLQQRIMAELHQQLGPRLHKLIHDSSSDPQEHDIEQVFSDYFADPIFLSLAEATCPISNEPAAIETEILSWWARFLRILMTWLNTAPDKPLEWHAGSGWQRHEGEALNEQDQANIIKTNTERYLALEAHAFFNQGRIHDQTPKDAPPQPTNTRTINNY